MIFEGQQKASLYLCLLKIGDLSAALIQIFDDLAEIKKIGPYPLVLLLHRLDKWRNSSCNDELHNYYQRNNDHRIDSWIRYLSAGINIEYLSTRLGIALRVRKLFQGGAFNFLLEWCM